MAKNKSNRTMVIHNIGDMVALENHNTQALGHMLKKLAKRNRSMTLIGLLTAGGLIYLADKSRKQEEELYKLSIRIKKLENKEGE